MDFDSSDLSEAQFDGKVKTQSFKQLQVERLIKEGKVIRGSMLAAAKEQELERVREFEVSLEDEQRHRRSTKVAPANKLDNMPLTRERFEE
jgi:hypothetical protein